MAGVPDVDRRLLAGLLVAGLLPWVVVLYPGGWYATFSWGWVDPAPLHVVSLPTYYFEYARGPLPRSLLAWPLAAVIYLGALASLAVADRRVTTGLLVLAGVDVFWFGAGLSGQRGITAVPVGAVVLFVAALWTWWRATVGADAGANAGD
ncbi:MAG: TIGR04206 family protein [Halobacteriaceae archaeon]